MYCGKCGQMVPDGAKFCTNCGAPAPGQPAHPGSGQDKPSQPVNRTEQFIAQRQAQKAAQDPQNGAYYPPQGQAPQNGAYYPPQGGAPYGQQNYSAPQNKKVRVSAKPQVRILGIPVGGAVGIVLGVVLLIVIVVAAFAVNSKKRPVRPTEKQTAAAATEVPATDSDPTGAAETEAAPTETEAPTDPTTTAKPAQTDAPTEQPIDVSNVGNPAPEDFTWYDTNDPDAIPSGAVNLTSGEEIGGRWKACFFYPDAVRELAAIEIWAGDRAVSVKIDPLQINYDGYWESEADMSSWSYEGAIDYDGSVTAYGDYGRIYFYTFFRSGGKQYALATVELQSGGQGYIALVRP